MTLPQTFSSLNVIRPQLVTSKSSNVSGILAWGGMRLFPPARRNWERFVLIWFIGVLRHMQRYFSHICDGTDVQAN